MILTSVLIITLTLIQNITSSPLSAGGYERSLFRLQILTCILLPRNKITVNFTSTSDSDVTLLLMISDTGHADIKTSLV